MKRTCYSKELCIPRFLNSPKKFPYLDDNNWLDFMALQGYKFKVICNIYGFCYAVPEMICKDFRQILDMDVLIEALVNFNKENEKHIKQI